MKLEVGQQAPAFSLYSSEKQPLSLDDYKGKKVLLLFFPLAFSSVCTAELCNVRDNIAAYNNLQVAVIGISVDSVYVLKVFKEQQQLNFPLLSDFNKEVSEAYGSIHETFGYGIKGVSKRSAFLIDENGVIQYAEVLENPGEQPDFKAIQATLGGLE